MVVMTVARPVEEFPVVWNMQNGSAVHRRRNGLRLLGLYHQDGAWLVAN